MSEISTDLATLYPNHLEQVLQTYLEAAAEAGKSGIVIPSGALKTAFLDDHTYPFKVNPHFKAWIPLTDNSNCFLIIREGEQPRLLLHQPEDYWHKAAEDPTGYWVEDWHIEPIGSVRDAHNHLGDPAALAFIGEETDLAAEWGFQLVNDAGMLNRIHYQRAYKTAYELGCLQLANLAASAGHQAARDCFFAQGSEFEIQQAYLAAIRHREQETPYSSIVALNENCGILHYQHYNQDRDRHQSMLIDAGANQCGYAADVTRTYSFGEDLFADLIDAMNTSQLQIIEEIRPGMSYVDLNARMHELLAERLIEFDLVSMSVENMLEKNLTFTFLPHGLGHLLGLQTHDVGGFQQSSRGEEQPAPAHHPALRLTRSIEEGQVFTIEPGLYFIPMLLDKLRQTPEARFVNWPLIESLLPYGGIRIEDNIAIHESRPFNLTREAFARL